MVIYWFLGFRKPDNHQKPSKTEKLQGLKIYSTSLVFGLDNPGVTWIMPVIEGLKICLAWGVGNAQI